MRVWITMGASESRGSGVIQLIWKLKLIELGDHLDEEGEGDKIWVRMILAFLAWLMMPVVVLSLGEEVQAEDF